MNNKKKVEISIFIIGIAVVVTLLFLFFPVASSERLNAFEKIPPKPDDFDAYARDIWKGAFVELCDIDDAYWKQPEFYSSWGNAKKSFYDSPDYSRWGVYGHGNMPREISYSFENLKKGDEFELCSFFHSGFGIWTYQGFQLVLKGNEYFDIEVTPNQTTMSPTFPVFENGWVKKIRIKIIAKQDNIPAGNYYFSLNVIPPSDKYSREKTKEVLGMTVNKEDYKKECFRFLKDNESCETLINLREKKYVNGGSYQTSQPLLGLGVTVK